MSLEKNRCRARMMLVVLPRLALAFAVASCSSSGAPDGSSGAAGAPGATAGNTGVGGASFAGSGSNLGGAAAGASPGGATTGGGGASGGAPSAAGSSGVGGVEVGGASGSGGAGGGGGQAGGGAACASVAEFATWPAGKGPAEIGKLAIENFKSHTGDAYGGAGYAWTFAYVGSLQLTQLNGDAASNMKLIQDFERYATGNTAPPSNAPAPTSSVDDRAFGDLPLEIFIEDQDPRSKKLGLDRADMQWMNTTSDGITTDARYWADDMFMITGLQVYAYRATRDMKYLTRAAKTMIAYLAALQQPDGHFWHTKQSKAYWGRANGWIAAGMTELLLELPSGADRDAILAGYKKQMDGLLAVQVASGADAGAWRQVLDVPSAQPESSCTAMFTFALITGVRNGWLTDAKYAAAARSGWLALGNKTNASGVLDKVCPGTGQADPGTLAQQQSFYTSITLGSNDQHGQAPLLWAARALLRPDCPGVR